MSDFEHTTTVKLGENRGNKRIWLEGAYLAKAGFAPGSAFVVTFDGASKTAIIRTMDATDPAGMPTFRKVSGRTRKDVELPIIDIACAQVAECFQKTERLAVVVRTGKIVITPARTLLQKAKRKLTPAAVALFAGGGLLSLAAERVGFQIVAANEIRQEFAEVHDRNHDGHMHNTSIEEARLEVYGPFYRATLGLDPVGLLIAGIPCEPYSQSRRFSSTFTKGELRDLPPEAHSLGDMAFWTLRAFDQLNPHTGVIECAPRFLTSGAGWITRHALTRMGYTVDARVIDAADLGALTSRKRAVLVATEFDQVVWPESVAPHQRLADVLLPPDDPRCQWFTRKTKPWLFAHWAKQTAKGSGFASTSRRGADLGNKLIIHYTDARVGTIKKRYLAGQGDGEVVAHPTRPGHYRWFALIELKRLMGLPDDYDVGDTKTLSGEIIGQGVVVTAFERIIRSVTQQPALKVA